ncbi:MarR family winged helix-turn-helix transcriptional regulator [Ningiella sp. W23]|uniref:MarR family winged helix-turn-helix transcriptional regulator n=1 Tax=Ningiella sp. W23 TaxID=3023715 RepID=UPI003756DED4
MFFLKDLPTKCMVENYAELYCPSDSAEVIKQLKMMREASILVRQLDSYFASHDISQLKFLILMVIDRELDRDWLYAVEISERLDVSKPVLSRAVKTLTDNGFLLTSKDSKDGRAIVLTLSDKGKSALESLLPDYFNILTKRSHKGE